jgi:hypothetical protein
MDIHIAYTSEYVRSPSTWRHPATALASPTTQRQGLRIHFLSSICTFKHATAVHLDTMPPYELIKKVNIIV